MRERDWEWGSAWLRARRCGIRIEWSGFWIELGQDGGVERRRSCNDQKKCTIEV